MSEFLFDNPYLGLRFSGDSGDDPEPTPTTPPLNSPTLSAKRKADDMPINLGHVYHVSYPTMKCMENSERGIRHAHSKGWSIDIDGQKDKVGTMLADHWQELMSRDGWRDPQKQFAKTRKLNTMTPTQWGRLQCIHGDKLITVDQAFTLCGALHVPVRFEPKAGNHWTVEDAQHLHGVAQAAGTKVVIATLDTDPYWRDRLEKFRDGGFRDVRRLRG